jgi:PelA/Pel-15E family pectate lyase
MEEGMKLTLSLFAVAATTLAQAPVVMHPLPPVLSLPDGTAVVDAADWQKQRIRVQDCLTEQMYGRALLGRPEKLKFVLREQKPDARGGRATRLRVGILFEGTEAGRQMELLVYMPNDVASDAKIPIFLGLNFDGNYTTVDDPDLPLPQHWALGLFENKLPDHKPTEAGRGRFAHMWSVDTVLERGWGCATAAYGEIEPDEPAKWQAGVRGLAKEPQAGDWGAVSAWAWGLSRALDYLVTNERIDASKVVVTGFSRLGKAALWAGATDPRFAAVVSHGSGAGGMALTKRIFGERTDHLVEKFPHWFCGNYRAYAGKEAEQPFDQHQVAALIAPRPLLATSGSEDAHADPEGEFLCLKAAAPAWELLGTKKPLKLEEWPMPEKLVDSRLGYFLRKGKHDVTLADWRAVLSWATKCLSTTSPPKAATLRYARRIGLLAAEPRAQWEAYFQKSDALRAEMTAVLAAELKTAALPTSIPAEEGESFEFDRKKAEQPAFTSEALVANLLSFQTPAGGWSKSVRYNAPRQPGMHWSSQEDAVHYAATLDNRSTTEQLKFLAYRFDVSGDARLKPALEKGLDFLLAAQFPNGGWPQCYPLEGSYHDSITLNDGAMLHAIELLQAAASGEAEWTWVDAERRKQAAAAVAKGVAALLALQVQLDGKPTVWAGQYDPLTMQPVQARGFEPAALSGGESVEVLRLLFTIRPVTPAISAAVDTALTWYAEHPLPGETELWARFYSLRTQRPIFPGKSDGRAWETEAAMLQVNPDGYDFTVKKPRDLPKWQAKWQKAFAKSQ